MIFKNVGILGIGHVEANNIITSAEIEEKLSVNMKRFDIKPNFIANLTGIEKRRIWDEGVTSKDVATQAGIKALEDAKIDKSKIDVLINTSVTKEYVEPSDSTVVQEYLGLRNDCINFDVTNACLSFVNGMDIAANMIESGSADYILIVNGETSRELMDRTIAFLSREDCTEQEFRNGFSSLTLGSGAVAMVLCRKDLHPEAHTIVGKIGYSNTSLKDLCIWKGEYMVTHASEMLKGGLLVVLEAYKKALEALDWNKKEIDYIIPHQVGIGHFKKFSDLTKVPLEKMIITFNEFGNMGPVSLPLTVSKCYQDGLFKKNDRIALFGFGSGINCIMMEVVW